MDFIIGGLSATCAGVFTNPFDVIKTRQQLQGELQKISTSTKLPYTGLWQSMKSIVRSDGITGLQKGLGPALAFQFAMNSTRLGIFETVDNSLHWTKFHKDSPRSPVLCIFWGAVSGAVSSLISSPLYLIKTQIQSQTTGQYAVGYQHHHKGTVDGLWKIFNLYGFRGLWKGSAAMIPRTAAGSAAQLSTFTKSKDFLCQYEIFRSSVFLTAVSASIISGFFVSIVMTPFDVVATRIFNQGIDKNGKGILYRGITDCFVKTLKIEGVRGLYKGFISNFCRVAPHTVLNLTFWEQLKKVRDVHFSKSDG